MNERADREIRNQYLYNIIQNTELLLHMRSPINNMGKVCDL